MNSVCQVLRAFHLAFDPWSDVVEAPAPGKLLPKLEEGEQGGEKAVLATVRLLDWQGFSN